jgi:hypothetical protein
MLDGVPLHEFDEARAAEYRARSDFTKTAILLRLADPEALVTIQAPFGPEVMKGEFYVVASPDGSYGAARSEFEAYHEEVEPWRWMKTASVEAYPVGERCRIETVLADGTHETSVVAEPGQWIVRHRGGEVTVVKADTFAERYEVPG